MKFISILIVACIGFSFSSFQAPTWKKEQLMSTKDLADKIKTNAKDKPLIFNVGPMENIKGAVAVGAATNITFSNRMESVLAMESKAKPVVVYCGCCSYASCPNIKPAYDKLMSLGFKNTKVLELPEGIKPDWVAKGYPVE
ncbi:MAG: rhodanese-like domain-containing protein [Bacteroidetes bacterium]|nr:rhodanese-like domain-containing protein [Bacteroidota bacterium]